jgi:MFS family permease
LNTRSRPHVPKEAILDSSERSAKSVIIERSDNPQNVTHDIVGSRRQRLVSQFQKNRELQRLCVTAVAFGMAAIGDSFVLLTLKDKFAISSSAFPLLLSGASISYLLFAMPVGILADRWKPKFVMLIGAALFPCAYGLLLAGFGAMITLPLVLVLVGCTAAMLDGVLANVASRAVSMDSQAMAISVVALGMALGRWGGATLFGFVWSSYGRTTALKIALIGSVVMVGFGGRVLTRDKDFTTL